MKKIFLTTLSVFALANANTPAVGAETTELMVNVESNFMLTIPATQTITNREVAIGQVFITGTIEPEKKVTVTTTTNAFKREKGSEIIPFSIKDDASNLWVAGDWAETEIEAGSEKKVDLSLSIDEGVWGKAKAGKYKGSIVFQALVEENQ